MLYTEREQQGAGWLLFATVIMIMGGIMRIIDAFWAFDTDDTDNLRVLFFDDDLNAYGWLWLVVGVLLVAAGFSILAGAEWARWFGVFMATLAAVSAMLWIYAFPIWSLVSILISVMVVYALTVYGGHEA